MSYFNPKFCDLIDINQNVKHNKQDIINKLYRNKHNQKLMNDIIDYTNNEYNSKLNKIDYATIIYIVEKLSIKEIVKQNLYIDC